MTWLEGLPDGDSDWDRLATHCPEAFDALAALVAAAWQDADPVLLELSRMRIAAILQNEPELVRRSTRAERAGLTEEKLAQLPSWPSSPEFTEAERACLALTEQFVVDANGVTDGLVANVTEHLGAAGCYAFLEAVSVLETFQRACLTLGIRTRPGLEDFGGEPRADQTRSEV